MRTRTAVLRFAAAGALLFLAVGQWPAPPASPRVGGDEDALFELALAAGVDRTDEVIRQRLLALAGFLHLATDGDAARREAEARALGLVRTDPVIRRHLIDVMRLAAGTVPPAARPDEATLRAAYAREADMYRVPPRVRLQHVFLSAARRGARLVDDAAAIHATLPAGAPVPWPGDPFARGTQLGPFTTAELAHIFGQPFADAVSALPEGQWSPPLASPYGLHLVRVEQHLPASQLPFEHVRGRIAHALVRQDRDARVAEQVHGWRK